MKKSFWNKPITFKKISKNIKSFISKKLNSWNGWYENIWNTLFSTGSSITGDRMIQKRTSGTTVDLTFPDTVNYDLAMDLYYNRKAGYKLGAFFCYSIIATPLTFMGFPHFDVEDWERVDNQEWWEDRFKFYNENMMISKQDIQKLCHITGTVGVFPWFDLKAGYVKLYFIKSKYITDIYTNPDTQELTGIRTEIDYTFTWDDNKDYNFSEVRVYTKSTIKVTRIGGIPPGVRGSETKRNPTGELPVFFTNDREPGEFEGHSDFERVISLVKAYSEINLTAHEESANMRAKLVQKVENKDLWLIANGFSNIDDVSIENTDFIVNVGEETTEILVPANLVDNHIKLMSVDFWNIIQTSKIPEIFWGLEAAGNYASAGKQDKFGMAFIKAKQHQADPPYRQLANNIMKLDALAYNQTVPEDIICSWDDFDSLTETERAEVFDKWASGIQKLTESHAIDLQGVHEMLLQLTKKGITEKYEEFKKQIEEYGTLRAMLEQEYGGMRDFQGGPNGEPSPGEDELDKLTKEINKNNGNGKRRIGIL